MTFPAQDLGGLIGTFWNNIPISSMGGSDELNRAWMAAQAQRGSAAVSAAAQLAAQQQANQMRFYELQGSINGQATDAATRWRSELDAQQTVQRERQRQEYAQLLGYDVGGTGAQTLAGQQFQNEVSQAGLNRQQQLQLAREQQNSQANLSREEQAAQLLRQRESLGSAAQESAYERALRQSLQSQQLTSTEQQNAFERQLRERLQSGQLTQQESEFARNYLLQSSAQGGYMENGQLTEAARAARSQEAMRAAELSGQIEGGGLTEASRAAREQERTQRAALAAQLLQAPKDVFRAGAYFRNLRGSDPAAMGLTGGGISGFNSLAQRLGGTPGTAGLEDVESQYGGVPSAGWAQQLQAMMAPSQGAVAQAATGTPEAMPTPTNATTSRETSLAQLMGAPAGGAATDDDGAVGVESWQGNDAAARGAQAGTEAEGSGVPAMPEEEQPGTEPGGPQGDPLSALMAGGMQAGGNFPGRSAPDNVPGGVIPYVDPRVLQAPEVRALVQDVRRQGMRDEADGRRLTKGKGKGKGASGPGGPQGDGPWRVDPEVAAERRYSDERFLRGLSHLNRRGVLGGPGTGPARPGTEPGGPVGAPLWPAGGDGTSMPSLQASSSLGGSSFNLAPSAPAPSLPSVDQGNQDAALNYMSNLLMQGVGNQDAQFLQKMSKTQRGAAEGALQALGLNNDDFEESVAQTRFANVGNVLSA